MAAVGHITRLLKEAEAGRSGAIDDLMNVVYEDLERMARSHLQKHFGEGARRISMEPAALVNESFMRLIKQRATYDNRGHFFSIATRMMIRILLDYRRRKQAARRGGGDSHVTVMFVDQAIADSRSNVPGEVDVEVLHEAVCELEEVDPRKADVMKMRVVWGLTNDEIAHALDLSRPTVEREWRFAKAWLAERMNERSE